MDLKSKYAACSHINRIQSEVHISEDVKDALSRNYRVLPVYEKAITDHAFSKTHSFQTNKLLQCRWREYKRINIYAKPEPYEFPNVNDFHFYNYNTCYKPEQSISARPNYRFCLKNGPGVDGYGELPLSSDVAACFRKSSRILHKIKMIKPQTNRMLTKPTPNIKTVVRRK